MYIVGLYMFILDLILKNNNVDFIEEYIQWCISEDIHLLLRFIGERHIIVLEQFVILRF